MLENPVKLRSLMISLLVAVVCVAVAVPQALPSPPSRAARHRS